MTDSPTFGFKTVSSIRSTIAFFGLGAVIVSSFLYTGEQHAVYAVSVFGAFALLLLSVCLHSGSVLRIGLPGSLLLMFSLWNAIAISWSKAPHVSIIDFGSLSAGVAVYLTLKLNSSDWLARNIDRLILGLGSAVAVHIAFQSATGMTPESRFLNPNSAAGYLNLIWPVAAIGFLLRETPHRSRLLYTAVIMLVLFAIGLTGSRGALFASLAAIAVLGSAGIAVLRQAKRSWLMIGLAVGALGIANISGGGEVASGLQSMANPGSAGASRFAIWSATWDMIKASPWIGHGPGIFYLAYPAFRLASDRSAGYFVHNDYLEFWFDSGIIGLLLFLLTGLATVYFAARLFQDARNRNARSPAAHAGIAAAAAIITLAVHGLFSYSFQMMPFLVIAGLRLAQLENSVPTAAIFRIPLPDMRGRRLLVFGPLTLAGITAWSLGSYVLYFERLEDGQEQAQVGDYAAAADSFTRARALWSQNDSAWYLQANVHYMALQHRPAVSPESRAHLVQRALELLDHAGSRNTLQPAVPLLKGLFRANYPDLAPGTAIASFRRALELDPRTVEARYALSQLLEQEGRIGEALAILREGLDLTYPPDTDQTPLVRRVKHLEKGGSRIGTEDTLAPRDQSVMPLGPNE